MKLRKAAWSLAGALVVAGAAALAWPDQAEKFYPGAGEKAAAARSYLGPLAGALPAYNAPGQSPAQQAQGAQGGAQGGASGGGPRAQGAG
ncbi:MAG: hypothetical protein K2Y29_16145, partial [Beijerinckiaceae bacterium]|nr:hypothetical protein [Beijerinckiaceae bacterium]